MPNLTTYKIKQNIEEMCEFKFLANIHFNRIYAMFFYWHNIKHVCQSSVSLVASQLLSVLIAVKVLFLFGLMFHEIQAEAHINTLASRRSSTAQDQSRFVPCNESI